MTAPRSPRRSSKIKTKTSTTTPTEGLTADLPGYATVESPAPPTAMTEGQVTEMLDGIPGPVSDSAGESAGLFDGQLPPKEAAAPTPTSTRPLDPKQLREPLRKAVLGASMAINRLLVRPIDVQLGVETGVWVATDEETEDIGDPLADIAARHAPIGLSGANDLGDTIAAVIGLVGYASRNLFDYLALRQAIKAGGMSVLETDEPAEDAAA